MRLARPVGDITQGVIWKQLLTLFVPLWFGTFFQQLYNTVDTVVVGRFVGKVALAAVGSTGVIVNLTVGIFTGLAAGAVVVIAQRYGARQGEEVHRSVHTAMLLSVIIGAVFTVVGFVLTPWALRAMDTTADALPGAILYQRVYFLGMIPNVIYNMGTGVLRAVGDSKRPLYFLIAASLCNIVLDLLLVVVVPLGVLGVAIATVASQVLSAVLVVISLMRSQSFDTDAVAAWTAYGKMDILFWMTITALSQALTTFAGQNYGAGKYDRLKKSVKISVGMSAIITIAMSAFLVLLARPILSIFTPDPDVLEIGVEMVVFLAPCYITYILVELLPGAIRGAGKSLVPMLISVFGVCGLRLLWLFLVVPRFHTIVMVEASYPITWLTTSVALLIYYKFGKWLKEPEAALYR